jgi:phosphatidylglycerol:prolipoprotein diacylglycerol transferase
MHPVLFQIGHYTVHTFGIILMIAFAVAVYRVYRAATRMAGVPGSPDPMDVLDVSVWMILAGVVGARALFVAIDWSQYRGQPATWLAIWQGGISFHGALIGGLLAMFLYTWRRRISVLKLADLIAPSAMIGYAIGRLGCLFNGCCYGAPTNMPWGIRFFDDGHWTPPSHPTQLYASLLSFAFFGILVRLERHKQFDGQLLGWYLILAAIERFTMEIWRAGYTSTVVA